RDATSGAAAAELISPDIVRACCSLPIERNVLSRNTHIRTLCGDARPCSPFTLCASPPRCLRRCTRRHFAPRRAPSTISPGRCLMALYGDARGRIIEGNPGAGLKLLGLAIAAFLVIVVLFASVARVQSGHVGVLTLVGRVTGEVLPEGIHLVNPFKVNNEMSIRTQEIKESASVPSSEGLVMALDTSLIYHVDQTKAAEVYQKIGPQYVAVLIEPNLRAATARQRLRIPRTHSIPANARWWQNRSSISLQACSGN